METRSINPSVILINYLKDKPKPISIGFTLYTWWDGERTDEDHELLEGFNEEDFSVFIKTMDFELLSPSCIEFIFSIRFEGHSGVIRFDGGEVFESFSGNINDKHLFLNN